MCKKIIITETSLKISYLELNVLYKYAVIAFKFNIALYWSGA